jgi:hypothetical protein
MRQLKNVKIKFCDYIKQENKMQQEFFSYRLSSKKPLQQESKILFDPLPRGGRSIEK